MGKFLNFQQNNQNDLNQCFGSIGNFSNVHHGQIFKFG